MGELLNGTGVTKVFAESVGGDVRRPSLAARAAAHALVFFYAHYFFASITAHMLAMFPPFVILLTTVGVPPLLAVFSLLCLANLTAGLTHYGTTTGPILYSANYVTFSRMVAHRLRRLCRQPRDMADGGVRVVESSRLLVSSKLEVRRPKSEARVCSSGSKLKCVVRSATSKLDA